MQCRSNGQVRFDLRLWDHNVPHAFELLRCAELAVATGEFSLAIGELSASELSKQLSHSLAVMSDVEKRAQDLQHAQAQEDAMTFMSTGTRSPLQLLCVTDEIMSISAEEYTRIINSVRVRSFI